MTQAQKDAKIKQLEADIARLSKEPSVATNSKEPSGVTAEYMNQLSSRLSSATYCLTGVGE